MNIAAVFGWTFVKAMLMMTCNIRYNEKGTMYKKYNVYPTYDKLI